MRRTFSDDSLTATNFGSSARSSDWAAWNCVVIAGYTPFQVTLIGGSFELVRIVAERCEKAEGFASTGHRPFRRRADRPRVLRQHSPAHAKGRLHPRGGPL